MQYIGIDVGRGFTNAYSEHNGKKLSTMFRSIVSVGRSINISDKIEKPIHIKYNSNEYFIGDLALKEGYQKISNLTDDKTSLTVETLIIACLNEIAKDEEVEIMLGVPYKLFKKSILSKIVEKYKGVEYTIYNKITNKKKVITISDINIFREADASLMWHTKDFVVLDKPIGLVNVGFRTTEFCYYDKELDYKDVYSTSKELGNKTVLSNIQNEIANSDESIMLDLYDIDLSDDFDDLKDKYYEIFANQVYSEIENLWINKNAMDIVIAGGTSRYLNLDYEYVDDVEMIVAKGLYYVLMEI